MLKFLEKFKTSAKELNNTDNLVICALLMGLTLAISSFTIVVTDSIKIGFSFVASELAYTMFGPVIGMFYGGLADIFAYILKPTGPYFYGFTVSGILCGLIYGITLYKKPVSFWRILIVKSIVTVFINILLGTYWLQILLGKGFFALLPGRVLKNLIMLPINTLIYYVVARAVAELQLTKKIFITKRKTATIKKL